MAQEMSEKSAELWGGFILDRCK